MEAEADTNEEAAVEPAAETLISFAETSALVNRLHAAAKGAALPYVAAIVTIAVVIHQREEAEKEGEYKYSIFPYTCASALNGFVDSDMFLEMVQHAAMQLSTGPACPEGASELEREAYKHYALSLGTCGCSVCRAINGKREEVAP